MFNYSIFIPSTTKEYIYIGLIFILMITLFMFYKALMKCRALIQTYVDEKRVYDKYLEFSNRDEEFKVFSSNVNSLSGDVDV